MTNNPTALCHVRPYAGQSSIQTANGSSLPIAAIGDASSKFTDVFLAPQLSTNPISVGQLVDNNCAVNFSGNGCVVQDQPLVNMPRLNEEEDWRRTSIFQTRVACQGRLCTLIIDGGSCSNLASKELVEKLNLKTEDHPNPYQIAWVNDTSILVSSRCLVTFNFSNNFELSAWCDVLPMKVAHIMLGRPWLFDEKVQHDGYENTYTLVRNGRKKILRPMKEFHHLSNQRKK
ncbi:hypothetical protein CK203_010779 [Vitis vinifera]|uniref:Uncharacterized protein n=1 Tax=Vitis vinifera TaxID=29760 RepID=A0A438JSW3_VITVI|nr:hypothetical protein CK203_010779 [Vitis vinifera]